MPLSDFLYVVRFWFVYFILGLIAFPLTSRIFSRFLDRGWIFSKTLGILLVSFLMWYAASFRILPFSFNSLFIITSLITLLSLISIFLKNVIPAKAGILKNLDSCRSLPRMELRGRNDKTNRIIMLIIFEEILFFACLLLWSYIRAFQPTIEGLEKYMDFGFINAILRSSYMPPRDIWLSGYTINYYYFGHFITAVLTRLSQIPPEVVYNLMIAVIFAFCFTSSFSIGINIFYHFLKNKFPKLLPFTFYLLTCGLLTAYLVTNAANLQPIYHFLTKGSSSYWYPDATRFIVKKFGAADETIHEFPHYSFIVADLHGHVSDIPTVLLLIAFIFVLFLKINAKQYPEPAAASEGSLQATESLHIKRLPHGILRLLSPLSIFDSLLLGFLLSTAYMTNAMDGPVYFALSGLAVFGIGGSLRSFKNAFLKSAVFFIFVGLSFFVFSYPFLKNFKNFTGGITPVDYRSPFWMLMILWGFQLFMGSAFLIFLFFGKIVQKESLAKIIAGLFGLQLEVAHHKQKKSAPSLNPLTPADYFIFFLLLLSVFLIIFPEIFYIKDIYIHEYQRANTMFKMTYQAFIMLYICAPYIFFRLLLHIKTTGKVLFPQILFLLIAVAGFLSVSFYPYYAIKSYYGMVNYQGLDGLKYLQSLYPDDYKLITSLNSPNHPILLRPQTVILEAVGDSYTKYARISANTGISTVLGWPVHEWLWRNGYDIPGKRTADVQKIYESTDLNETKKILKQYKVDYVWIGQLEREKYANLNEFKFRKIGKAVLKIGNSVLYKIN